jgi:hypothetical protein
MIVTILRKNLTSSNSNLLVLDYYLQYKFWLFNCNSNLMAITIEKYIHI